MPCLFCDIIKNKLPADIVYRNRQFVVFRDIKPKARVHLLIVPCRHIESVNALKIKDALLIGKMILLAQQMAREQGVSESGYQLVINTGRGAGQLVEHLHLHLIAA